MPSPILTASSNVITRLAVKSEMVVLFSGLSNKIFGGVVSGGSLVFSSPMNSLSYLLPDRSNILFGFIFKGC